MSSINNNPNVTTANQSNISEKQAPVETQAKEIQNLLVGGATQNVLGQITSTSQSLKALMLSIAKDRETLSGLREDLDAAKSNKSETNGKLQAARSEKNDDGEIKNPELVTQLEGKVSGFDSQIENLTKAIEDLQKTIAGKMEDAKEKEDEINKLVNTALPNAEKKDQKVADDAAKVQNEQMEAASGSGKEVDDYPGVQEAKSMATKSAALRQSIYQENRSEDSFQQVTTSIPVARGGATQDSGLLVE